MALYHVVTALGGEARAEALAEAIEALGPVATETRDHDDGSGLWDVGAHFAEAPDRAGLALLASMHGAPDFAVARVDDRDWVAQVISELTPVEAGRFVVHGAHDRERVAPSRIGLEIEAAQAFGTGHHATTRGCLLAIDRLVRRGFAPRRVADLGAGTGVLAMAAASVWRDATVIAGDIDPVATATAAENAHANGLGGRIACVTAAGFRHPRLMRGGRYDLVLANILASPLKALAGDLAPRQSPGGIAILSGLLSRQAPGVLSVYGGRGYRRIDVVALGEWTTLVLRRP